jgi:3-deoxy-D-manno-octulosonic-acid transferase
MLFVYRIIINIIFLLSPLIILIRLLKKKEDLNRFKEKFCLFSKKRSKGKLIWFHGASVGEILSVIPIVEKLEKNKNIKQILITSNTLSSSKILFNLKLKKTIHHFFPIDNNYLTKKFLDYWKPSIAMFIDSEIWPNMIKNIKDKSIPLLLLNARMNDKSFKKWNKVFHTAKKFFQSFDICLASSLETKKHLEFFGVKKIKYIGNLKFTESEREINNLEVKLKKKLLTKKIWCASSTHNGEEIFCAKAHKKLKKKHKNLLTIIIPRHIDRMGVIEDQMKRMDLKVHRHVPNEKIKNDTDIYIVNSYGKTKSFFKICKTVFLGGSIIEHGGQNPLEAARYGCKILHGPNIWNFKEVYDLLKKYKVTNKVTNMNQLVNYVNKMLNTKNNSQNLEFKIKSIGNKILNSTLNEINFFINKK